MPTSNFSWPYPASTDAPNVPTHIRNLADAADATVGDIVDDLDIPVAQMRQTSSQSILDNSFMSVSFNAEDVDNKSGHDTATNNSRYTCQRAGWYRLTGGVSFAPNAAEYRGCRWTKNGSDINGSQALFPSAGAGLASLISARSVLVLLAVGDYVELQAYQNTGGTLSSAVAGSQQPVMTVTFVRDP